LPLSQSNPCTRKFMLTEAYANVYTNVKSDL